MDCGGKHESIDLKNIFFYLLLLVRDTKNRKLISTVAIDALQFLPSQE